MRISAIICTHNRAQMLAEALAGCCAQTLPADRFEVLVVDNASTDETRSVVDRAIAASSVTIRYLFEDELGLSHARNRGLADARGDLVVYLDDDAVPEPGWLAALVAAFDEGGADVAAVAGRIGPIYHAPRPTWMADQRFDYCAGLLDLGDERREAREIIGANAAFRRDALREAGGFSPNLGRQGRRLLSGEESAVSLRLRAAGLRVVYEPDAVVAHHVPASRMDPRYLARWGYWHGVSMARLRQQRPETPDHVAGRVQVMAAFTGKRVAAFAYHAARGALALARGQVATAAGAALGCTIATGNVVGAVEQILDEVRSR